MSKVQEFQWKFVNLITFLTFESYQGRKMIKSLGYLFKTQIKWKVDNINGNSKIQFEFWVWV